MSGELDEIGYQLKELNKNIKELGEHFGMLEELGELYEIRKDVDKLLEIQKEYMNLQGDIANYHRFYSNDKGDSDE